MITEIKSVVDLLFNDPKESTDCVNEIFDYFGEHINEKEVDSPDFMLNLLKIFVKYKGYIKEGYWDSIKLGPIGSNSIPYNTLWNLFESERTKHS